MAKIKLKGFKRENLKKGKTHELRRQGMIPSVIYGHRDPIAIAIDAHEFNTQFKTISENIIIELNIDKEKYAVLVKDYQEDVLKNRLTHLDFFEIEKGKLLRTHVPLHCHGTPEGARVGGLFEVMVHEVEVECLPKDIPADIVVDVTELTVGHSIHIKEVEIPAGVKVLNPPEQVVCLVTRKREEVVETSDEEMEEEGGEESSAEE